MPAPSPLKKQTDVVSRFVNDEKSYFKQYTGPEAEKIEDAKAAKEDEEGNRDHNIRQATMAQQETLKTYHSLFDKTAKFNLPDAVKNLEEELKEMDGGEVDEATKKEMEKAKEILAEAQKKLDEGPRLPGGEEDK